MSACLGLTWLGTCPYNPALPSPSYFTLGNAIAALAFTMAVQTFLKPIYRVRLAIRYFSIGRLYILIFVAVGMTFVAALVPSLPILHGGWWGYPIVYELLAAILFAVAYGSVAFAVVRPLRVSEKRVEIFAQYVARTLSEATESDCVDLLHDLQLSLPRLIKLASFIEGRRDASAFWMFIHRKQIWQAQYAASLLRILSDQHFCRSVVVRAPWTVARLISDIADEKLYARSAENLVQGLALQAILCDEGIMTREIQYNGFAEAPVLSNALFSEPFIVERYNPLNHPLHGEEITASVLKRFNKATIRCYECIIEEREFHRSQVTFSIERFYRSAGLRAWILRDRGAIDIDFSLEFSQAVTNAIALSVKLMAAADEDTYNAMFVTNLEDYRHDPLEPLVEIVFNALGHIAKGFTGPDDTFWHLAIEVILKGYSSIGVEPDGMTPFQQRLTLKLIDKLEDNMKGYYPAVCRVLLATVGPYMQNALQPNMTAFNILRNLMYRELKRLPDLAATKPDRIPHYLPNSSTYDVDTATLTHTYFGGAQQFTDLRTLQVVDIDLLNEKYRRDLSAKERESAKREIY
jgi:hypothetical protein